MKSKYFFGLMLVLFGVLLLLQNLGFLTGVSVWKYVLPVIITGIGVSNIASKKRADTIDIIFVVIGLMLFASRLNLIGGLNVWQFIVPLIIIIIGLSFLTRKKTFVEEGTALDSKVDVNAFFSGVETKCSSSNFEFGEITAVFGGAKFDLSEAVSHQQICRLDVNAFFGGVEIIVPKDWKVNASISGFMGGYENKTIAPMNPATILNITGNAFCGGVEILNSDK